ncbi:ABC transporter permease [Romboutsia maritimum]|uniref:ABC transporter permease n=1 Tax=Romboutsia maritimum TaxID=2020948 RepID=A0A371IVV9_9FIRM|nr:ABC transporter permease [Romboutsia maritimum]RDY24609.1 ABC transporter permease [Romboutsia maritimum]
MKKYVLKKILSIIPIMLVVSIIAFGLVTLSSGNIAEIVLRGSGVKASEESIRMVTERLGLDKPIYIQYWNWLKGILRLDFGKSYMSGLPITNDLIFRSVQSAKLALYGLIILVSTALPLGILSALYPKSLIDKGARGLSFLSASLPGFWVGLMILYLFGVKLKMISVIGSEDSSVIIFPAFTLALGSIGSYIRLIRINMLEVIDKSYIKAARAKGLSEKIVILKHALKNAMLPILTKFGVTIGAFLGGSTVVEIVFSYRGLGTYVMSAITNKDFPVIQAYVILIAAVIVIINLLVDILYIIINPKIELK